MRARFPSSFALDQSSKREDRLVVFEQLQRCLWCVFDGHRGHQVAAHAAQVVPKLWREAMDLREVLLRCNEMARAERLPGGSTALLVATCEDRIWCCSCGDSRAVALLRNGHVQRLSAEHTCAVPAEVSRVRRSAPLCCGRLGGLLPMTRGLGNFDLEAKGFACLPETESVAIHEVQLVILASDGLWDVLSDQETCALVAQGLTAQELVKEARRRGSADDIAVIAPRSRFRGSGCRI